MLIVSNEKHKNIALLSIDIGGTSVKYALSLSGSLSEKGTFLTPSNIEELYYKLKTIVEKYKQEFLIEGVALSVPGAVNKVTGIIEGISALPYIHNFNIRKELQELFNLPISIENDANCAALAEVNYGVAKGLDLVLFMILGTGVGGSVVINGKVRHGPNLFSGEFGYTLVDSISSLSQVGTTISMEKRYNSRQGTNFDAIKIYQLASLGDLIAKEEVDTFLFNVARSIFNLTYSFDPDLVVLGGGVSQADWLIPGIQKQFIKIRKIINCPFNPPIAKCKFQNESNLIGASVDFIQTYF